MATVRRISPRCTKSARCNRTGKRFLGTAISGTLENNASLWIKIAAGLVSILAAVLAALQTSLNPLKESERHRVAGGKLRAPKREFELYGLQFRDEGEVRGKDAFSTLEKLFRDRSELAEEGPNIPDKLWEAARKQYNQFPKHAPTAGRAPLPPGQIAT
ncbi:MAG TPA: SLATT domain-containing protein [Stellaceae bacterium]|nr:SLATT domain-containing protein [Stellaceae bacterium]